jgi:hypothetical protein
LTYDDNFIIFGNSEIRIRNNEKQLFSNFAIENSHFEKGKNRLEDFTGDKKARTLDLISYEYIEVKFEYE